MTTSNHRPFTYPDGRIDIPSPGGRDGARQVHRLRDRQVHRRRARRSPGSTTRCSSSSPTTAPRWPARPSCRSSSYRIPLIFYAPDMLAARRVHARREPDRPAADDPRPARAPTATTISSADSVFELPADAAARVHQQLPGARLPTRTTCSRCSRSNQKVEAFRDRSRDLRIRRPMPVDATLADEADRLLPDRLARVPPGCAEGARRRRRGRPDAHARASP